MAVFANLSVTMFCIPVLWKMEVNYGIHMTKIDYKIIIISMTWQLLQ